MSTIMPAYLLPVFTLLQRFFLLYMPAALGALVVMGELRPKENEPVESESQLIDAVERPVSQRLAEEN